MVGGVPSSCLLLPLRHIASVNRILTFRPAHLQHQVKTGAAQLTPPPRYYQVAKINPAVALPTFSTKSKWHLRSPCSSTMRRCTV